MQAVKDSSNGTDTITFKYDPFGRRIEKNVETVEGGLPTTYKYIYVYDNEDIILEVLDKTQSGATMTEVTTYVHGPGIDEPLSLTRGGQTYYYHSDGLGSITSMTDGTEAAVNRYAYDSFGRVKRTETIWNDLTFTGREYDFETGLFYLRARYYDPEAGRFVSKDPIGFAGGDVNLYGYTNNNPLNLTDPYGLIGYDNILQFLGKQIGKWIGKNIMKPEIENNLEGDDNNDRLPNFMDPFSDKCIESYCKYPYSSYKETKINLTPMMFNTPMKSEQCEAK